MGIFDDPFGVYEDLTAPLTEAGVNPYAYDDWDEEFAEFADTTSLDPFEGWNPIADPAGVLSGTGAAGGEMGEEMQVVADPLDVFGHQADADQAAADLKAEEAKTLEQQWLNYIKKEYAPYSEVSRKAMGAQMGLVGLGGAGVREKFLAEIEADPLYRGKVRAGEEAVLRGSSATGGLRSGDASSALALQNQAILGQEIENRYSKLAGLSGLGFSGQQAMTTAGGASTSRYAGILGQQASGILAAGAAKREGMQGLVGGVVSMFSDERLKTCINKLGEKHGLPWYEWEWNQLASSAFDLYGTSEGHMASEVAIKYPDLIGVEKGFKTVNYGGFDDGV